MNRRQFCLSTAACAVPAGWAAAATPAGEADARLATTLDGFYRTALDGARS